MQPPLRPVPWAHLGHCTLLQANTNHKKTVYSDVTYSSCSVYHATLQHVTVVSSVSCQTRNERLRKMRTL